MIFSPIILSSKSNLILCFSKTLLFTKLINFSISSEEAPPSLTKKLQCFFDMLAFPNDTRLQLELLINSQAFLFFGFLKVLPQVLI